MKKFIFKFLRYSGLPYFFREILQKNKVTILMFHDIDRNTAQNNFNYLLKNYNIISLNEFIKASETNSKLPKKSLIITFDDGHVRNYEMLPYLKKYNLPITIFLCSSIINTNRNYWFKYKHLNVSTDELKKLKNKERLNELKKIGFDERKEYHSPQALNKNQIKEMSKYVNFQSHTMFHPCLSKCDENEVFNELFQSKKSLEKEYKFLINSIAYPNGDYSENILTETQKVGYKCGITVDYGFNTIDSDLYRLKRVSTNDTSDLNEFIVRASGLWGFLQSRF